MGKIPAPSKTLLLERFHGSDTDNQKSDILCTTSLTLLKLIKMYVKKSGLHGSVGLEVKYYTKMLGQLKCIMVHHGANILYEHSNLK